MIQAAYDKTVLGFLSSVLIGPDELATRWEVPIRRSRQRPAASMNSILQTPINLRETSACRLWIDGVGSWLIWFNDQLELGNAFADQGRPERLRIFADLRTRHAVWKRTPGGDRILPVDRTAINDQAATDETFLRSGDRLKLGSDVVLGYQVPSQLSPSAVLKLESGHRFASLDDGVVLFSGTCLIGAGSAAHIHCPAWKETLVLFERDGKLMWKMQNLAQPPQEVRRGEVLEGDDWRVRIEAND